MGSGEGGGAGMTTAQTQSPTKGKMETISSFEIGRDI